MNDVNEITVSADIASINHNVASSYVIYFFGAISEESKKSRDVRAMTCEPNFVGSETLVGSRGTVSVVGESTSIGTVDDMPLYAYCEGIDTRRSMSIGDPAAPPNEVRRSASGRG